MKRITVKEFSTHPEDGSISYQDIAEYWLDSSSDITVSDILQIGNMFLNWEEG